jgi:hypothetical protein
MEPERVRHALALLVDNEYIGGYKASGGHIDSIMPRERGLQETMGWPTPADDQTSAELLLRLLDQRIASAPTEEERTRFQRLRNAAADTGQGILSEVLAALISRASGLG